MQLIDNVNRRLGDDTPRTPHPWEVLGGLVAGLLGFGGGDELQVLVGGDFGCLCLKKIDEEIEELKNL